MVHEHVTHHSAQTMCKIKLYLSGNVAITYKILPLKQLWRNIWQYLSIMSNYCHVLKLITFGKRMELSEMETSHSPQLIAIREQGISWRLNLSDFSNGHVK